MELLIDGISCELSSCKALTPAWSRERLSSPEAWREGWSLTLDLPRGANNDALFGYAFSPHAAERFNHSIHQAELRHEGALLHRGTVRLLESSGGDEGYYRVELRGGAARWAKLAAKQSLDTLPIEHSMRLLPSEMIASWRSGSPLCMLPILYDRYESHQAQSSTLQAERILTVEDYHPFLHLATLVEAIFSQAGYELCSDFMQGLFFRSLYMSGSYPMVDTTARRNRFDFLARRSRSVAAEANYSGRVYASPTMLLNTVGNLVDAFTPQSLDEEGNPLSDCFSRGGYLRLEEGVLTFRPSTTLTLGFEYHLLYESAYRILDRERLTGFDSIYLGEGADVPFRLANRFEDRRAKPNPGQAYRAIRFEHQAGERNRLLVDGVEIASFSDRSAVVILPETGDLTSLEWQVMPIGADYWVASSQDWALYDGHVAEEGLTEVEITLSTPPEEVGPNSPKRFDQIYFYGAEPGMTLRLLRGSSLRPRFASRPAYGSTLTLAEVAPSSIRQIDLLEALFHLFNLRVVSDEEQRRVYIEPATTFYEKEAVVDWTNRHLEGSIRMLESDRLQHESRLYGYRQGDGAVERLEREQGEPFASILSKSPSKATLEGCEVLRNPLFAPTLNEAGSLPNAPSALIPRVGNRDWEEVEEGDFLSRILRYEGLTRLPAGEMWGWPSGSNSYPLAAFHHPKVRGVGGYTLCFEDREGEKGLFRYYAEEEEILARGQEVEVALKLSAEEFSSLARWAEAGEVGCNALFRLRVEGEPVRARLSSIERYDPQSEEARCRFTLIPDERP